MRKPREILESYSRSHPRIVLVVEVDTPAGEDQVLIFKGFSSSLRCATAFDPDVPVISDDAKVRKIGIVLAPYNPRSPLYLQQDLSWGEFCGITADGSWVSQ